MRVEENKCRDPLPQTAPHPPCRHFWRPFPRSNGDGAAQCAHAPCFPPQVDFSRPPPETDKLYMNIGGNDIIEVGHPPPPPEAQHL